MPITHRKVSLKPDDGRPNVVQASDWNANHDVDALDLPVSVSAAVGGGVGAVNGLGVVQRLYQPWSVSPIATQTNRSILRAIFARPLDGGGAIQPVGVPAPTMFGTAADAFPTFAATFRERFSRRTYSTSTVNGLVGMRGVAGFPFPMFHPASLTTKFNVAASIVNGRASVGFYESTSGPTPGSVASPGFWGVWMENIDGATIHFVANDTNGVTQRVPAAMQHRPETMYAVSVFAWTSQVVIRIYDLETKQEEARSFVAGLPIANELLIPWVLFRNLSGTPTSLDFVSAVMDCA